MSRALLQVLLLTVFSLAASGATIVTFDDLAGDNILVPDGYGGINWGGVWTYYGFDQAPFTPKSPPNRIYDLLPEGQFSFITPAVFDGAWFSGFEDATVTFNLYYLGSLVWTSATLAPTDVPAFLASGYGGLVDMVGVVSPRPDFFVMDDVTYQAIPEPGSVVLMGGGLLALFVRYLRRRNA